MDDDSRDNGASPCDVQEWRLDLSQGVPQLMDALLNARFASGDEPIYRCHEFDWSVPVRSIVPAEATVEREGHWAPGHKLLCTGDGWSMLATSWTGGGITTAEVTARTAELMEAVMASIVSAAPTQPSEDGRIRLSMWHRTKEGPKRSSRLISAPQWSDVSRNYPSTVAAQLGKLTSCRAEEVNGKLVLLHGAPGTGKTTFLRALGREWRDWCDVHYVMDAESFLTDPDYMLTTVVGSEDDDEDANCFRLIVIEDLGTTISEGTFRFEALNRLLNLTDGMLGQELNFLLVVTTNLPKRTIAPSVLRPGRCLARLELRPFQPREASAWLERAGTVDEPMTIAELLARRGDLAQVATVDSDGDHTGQYL